MILKVMKKTVRNPSNFLPKSLYIIWFIISLSFFLWFLNERFNFYLFIVFSFYILLQTYFTPQYILTVLVITQSSIYTCLYSNILKTQDGFSGSGSGTPIKPNHLEIMGNGSAQRSTNGKVSYSSINFFISKFFVDLSYTFKKLILHLYILNFFFWHLCSLQVLFECIPFIYLFT